MAASGQWGSTGWGRALAYKGVILAQASISQEGTLAHPHPKVITATSFWFLSCSEGKMCGLGCGRGQEDSEGPAGQGWCHCVSQTITWITKASISCRIIMCQVLCWKFKRTISHNSPGRKRHYNPTIQLREMKLREVK